MSNHTRVNIELENFNRMRNECRNELISCARGCDELGRSFSQSREALSSLKNDITNLQMMSTGLDRVPGLIGELQQATAELESYLIVAEQHGIELDRAGRQSIRTADSATEGMKHQLAEAENVLQGLGLKISTGLEETRTIGNRLDAYFNKIADIMEGIQAQKDHGEQLDRQIGITWDQFQDILTNFSNAREQWTRISSDIQKDYAKFNENIFNLGLMVESIEHSAEATYAIVRTLTDENFRLAAYQRTENGIEAFLKDQDDRMIALQIRPDKDIGESILLDLDLSGFDPEKTYKGCDRKIGEVLEKLTDIGVLFRRKTEHPHKRGRGEGKVLESFARKTVKGKRQTQKIS